eukprot:Awhi_evm3s1381
MFITLASALLITYAASFANGMNVDIRSSKVTCKSLFFDEGKDYCQGAGYANRRSSSSPCTGDFCHDKDCCKNYWDTCGSLFESKGKDYCDRNGYESRKSSSIKCKKANKDLGCGTYEKETCCKKPWKTCGDFFKSKGKDYCEKNGYKHRRNSSTDCWYGGNLYGCGDIKVCCKNVDSILSIDIVGYDDN